jgi:hypothetical protein
MSDRLRVAVLVQPADSPAAHERVSAALAGQLGPADRMITAEDATTVAQLGVDAVAVLSGTAVPSPGWLAAQRRRLLDRHVGASTGPVLRFTDGRATNVLVANKLGGALTGAGAWSDVPPRRSVVDPVSQLPSEHYAVRAGLVGKLRVGELTTIRGRAEILAACARSGLAVVKDSDVQVEVHAPRSSTLDIRTQLAYDAGYLHTYVWRHGSSERARSVDTIVRWGLVGSARSPGLLPSLLFLVSGGPRGRIARAALTGRRDALRD